MRRSLFLFFVFFMVSSAHTANWTSNGPQGGDAWAVVAASSDARVLYVGTGRGIFRSTDRGETWTDISGGHQDVTVIAAYPQNPDVVYMTSGRNTIATMVSKSTDGGLSWQKLSLPEAVRPVAIVIDPRNPNIVYVGSNCQPYFKIGPQFHEAAGIFKSTDGGATWIHTTSGLQTYFDSCISSLSLDPASPDTLYANSTLRSDDGGRTWWQTGQPMPGYKVVADPRVPARRYGIRTESFSLRILVTNDSGATWEEVNPAGIAAIGKRSTRPSALTIDPTTGRLFLGSEAGLYRSGDGGSTWLPIEGPAMEPIHAVTNDPGATALTIGTQSGVYRSEGFPWSRWKELRTGDSSMITRALAHRLSPGRSTPRHSVSFIEQATSGALGSWRPSLSPLPRQTCR